MHVESGFFFFMVTFIYSNMRRIFFFLAHFPRRNSSNRLNLCRQKKMRYFGFLSSKTVIQVFFFPKMRLYWDLCKKKTKIFRLKFEKNSPKNNISQIWAVDQKLLWYFYLDINFIYSLRTIGNKNIWSWRRKDQKRGKIYRK